MAKGIDDFARWLRAERYAASTIEQYLHYAGRAAKWAHERGLGPLWRARPETLRAWWDALPVGTTTRRNGRKAIIAFYRFTGRAENPGHALPQVAQLRGKPRPYSTGEHLMFLGAAHALGGMHDVIGTVFATTGCRFNELRRARREQFDLWAGEWKIHGKGSWMSGPRARIFPLHSECVPVVRTWFLQSGSPDFLFPNEGPSAYPYIGERRFREVFREILAQAGLPRTIVPHRVRHTFATEALDRGTDLRVLQELLGHESLASTQVYTKVTIARMRQAVEALPA